MSTKKFLIISIAAILGSTAFNYASVGDVRQHSSGSRSYIAMLASTFYNYSFMGSSSGSRSYNGSRVGGGYSSGWHK